ncbi:MAG: hypothetical protein PHI40_05630 [Caldisericia bacterium]|nr:hypothetical protein [Caldisericia bacterium]
MCNCMVRKTLCVVLLGFIFGGQAGCGTGLFQFKKQVPVKEVNSIATKTESKAEKPPKKDWFILLQDKEMSKISTNMSMILAQKVDKHVSVYRKNLIQPTSIPIFSWNEQFSIYESIFVPPCIAISPSGRECIYSTSTQFLLRDMQTDATTVLAEVCDIDEGFLEGYTDSSKIQGWQYYYSDFHKQPIIGVYQPRYPKWSFDGRYFSVSIPIFREGAGEYVFDRDAMKEIHLPDYNLYLEGGGNGIHWSSNTHQFVVASSQTGWSEREFVLVDMNSIEQYMNLIETMELNLRDPYVAKMSPDNTKIAFLGTLNNYPSSDTHLLFEVDISTSQVQHIHEYQELDFTAYSFFYSQDGNSIYFTQNHGNSMTLYQYNRETRMNSIVATFLDIQPDTTLFLSDAYWHKELLFLTFYLQTEPPEYPSIEDREFYTHIIALDSSHEKVMYQSGWMQGIASILRVE